jgi:hypothetical protein
MPCKKRRGVSVYMYMNRNDSQWRIFSYVERCRLTLSMYVRGLDEPRSTVHVDLHGSAWRHGEKKSAHTQFSIGLIDLLFVPSVLVRGYVRTSMSDVLTGWLSDCSHHNLRLAK